MSNFFEVTIEDIVLVAGRLSKDITEEEAEEIMDSLELDFDKDCQYTDDLEEQTNIVYDSLENQLKKYFENK